MVNSEEEGLRYTETEESFLQEFSTALGRCERREKTRRKSQRKGWGRSARAGKRGERKGNGEEEWDHNLWSYFCSTNLYDSIPFSFLLSRVGALPRPFRELAYRINSIILHLSAPWIECPPSSPLRFSFLSFSFLPFSLCRYLRINIIY